MLIELRRAICWNDLQAGLSPQIVLIGRRALEEFNGNSYIRSFRILS